MSSTRVEATVYEELEFDGGDGDTYYIEFEFSVPVDCWYDPGTTNSMGVPTSPEQSGMDIDGEFTITNLETDETMTREEFIDRYGEKAEEAMESVEEGYELYEDAQETAARKEREREREAALDKAERRGVI